MVAKNIYQFFLIWVLLFFRLSINIEIVRIHMYKAALVLVWTALAARLTPIRLGAVSIMPKRPRRERPLRRSQTSTHRNHFITHPRPLNKRERTLIFLYSYCQLGMTPQQFYSKWDVTHEDIALICCRSHSIVRRWFQRGHRHCPPHANERAPSCPDGLYAGAFRGDS